MKKRMNKTGQFYIIAAIIILLAVAAVIGVKNYAVTKPAPRQVESMGNELNQEGLKIVDYGIFNQKNTTQLLNNFTEKYGEYFLKKTENANVIFLYGNKTVLYSTKYDSISTGKVTASIPGAGVDWQMENSFVNRTKITSFGNSVTLNILEKDYVFELKDNEMFYFVIVQAKEDETYIEKS